MNLNPQIEITFQEYCERNAYELLLQWDMQKNAPLTPKDVSIGSRKKVWWRCEQGHQWMGQVSVRVAGSGCPVCAGRRVLTGFNDLATTHPQLAVEWHPTKNGIKTPERVGRSYDRKVWWLCKKGHEWQATVKSRTYMASGCPICSNHYVLPGENDLATTHPHLAAEWHPNKNGELNPRYVVAGSNRNVWWMCSLGHTWRARISDRTRNSSRCPYCSNHKVLAGFNDLSTTNPEVALQWHPTLNGDLTPERVTAGSNRRVWWICADGHVWRTAVCNRTGRNKHTNCPICAGNTRIHYKTNYAQSKFR